MVTNQYLKKLSESAGYWWTDTAEIDTMDEAIENGATGVTTNPILVKKSLYAFPDFWRPYLKSAEGLKGDAKAEEIIRCITVEIAKKFQPIYEATEGVQGYVCAQVNPKKQGDTAAMVEMGRRLAAWAPNIAVKVPATAAGLRAIEELAAAINVPAENLKKTIEDYNAAVEKGEPDQFGREFNVSNTYNIATNKIEGEKYYAIRLHALCVMTLGGVTANSNMQVLDEAGNVIPGLYAAGEVVGGIWGKFVSGGTGVMGPIVFGKIAAAHAMNNEMAEGYEVKPAANLLDEALFAKEVSTEKFFDMTRAIKDGEYTATVDGQNGPMTVKTVVADGKIASVEVVENNETQGIAAPAIEAVTAAIVANNDATVDTMAGATLTSNRIMSAVALCLEEAAK